MDMVNMAHMDMVNMWNSEQTVSLQTEGPWSCETAMLPSAPPCCSFAIHQEQHGGALGSLMRRLEV